MKTINNRFFALAALVMSATMTTWAKNFQIASPDNRTKVEIVAEGELKYRIVHNGKEVMKLSEIGIMADGTNIYKGKASVQSKVNRSESIDAPLYRQNKVEVTYNELALGLGNGWAVVFRAYDEGVAYRFRTTSDKTVVIDGETAEFRFDKSDKAWLAYTTNDKKPEAMAFQNIYDETRLESAQQKLAFLPVTVESGGAKLTVMESDLKHYPGMFVEKNGEGDGLKAWFARYPKTFDKYPWRQQRYVTSTEGYIAKWTPQVTAKALAGKKNLYTTPWRIVAIADRDIDMPVNNLVFALAEPSRVADTSWIKPGKVAWDWWNDWNLSGVDFEAGINYQTYCYYIDFAARNGIEYVVLDEGWYDSQKGDIMNPIAEVRLPELMDYAKKKGVDVVLWTVFNVLDEHLEEAMEKYKAMGVKGFKIDFLDRDDQEAVDMAYRIALVAARYGMMLDYHGYFKPTGMSRTFPNIVNYEGVFGMEEVRWTDAKNDMPRYDVTFPYIRMMAGSVDYTPGAMRNGTKDNWKAIYTAPISMGTRCHQLACYVVHDSPFTMLCDTPTSYEREQESTDMIASIPTVFDRTRVVQGEMGKYIVTAREKDGNWYVGGLANWDGRDVELKLDFLEGGAKYEAVIFRDGINANRNAEDYKREVRTVDSNTVLKLKMASGGGFVASFVKK